MTWSLVQSQGKPSPSLFALRNFVIYPLKRLDYSLSDVYFDQQTGAIHWLFKILDYCIARHGQK